MTAPLPDPAVIVLVGPSGAGKSAWAARHYRPVEIVSSDALRAVVGSGENDLAASADALRLLDDIVLARIGRGLTTIVDTLGTDPMRRRRVREAARAAGLPAVVVRFDTPAAVCRERNRQRDRPVPATVLDGQLRRMQAAVGELDGEGWDRIVALDPTASSEPAVAAEDGARGAVITPPPLEAARLGFRLQISRFPWGDEPVDWLASIGEAAVGAGFEGLALMDHLIQIPQVGRAWEPIPQPWVTLGLLAGRFPNLALGPLVSPATFYSPGVLAKAAATLDVFTGGRAFVGVGAGWWEREHAGFGIPFPPAGARMDDLARTIETMRALWGAGTKPYAGERLSLPETTCYPRPLGAIPVIVGGGGERRTLAIAAQLGDACNLPSELATVTGKVAVLHEHCRRIGRDPTEVAITVLDVPIVGTDREDVAARVERLRGRTPASTFARRHHAGVAADHVRRYRDLAALGVRTVFVALPDLKGPEDLTRFTTIIEAATT